MIDRNVFIVYFFLLVWQGLAFAASENTANLSYLHHIVNENKIKGGVWGGSILNCKE